MKVTIEVEMDNAAFERSPVKELGRVLRRAEMKVADMLNDRKVYVDDRKLLDVNGNTVGFVKFER